MTIVSASEAKNRFGQIMEKAKKSPVVVASHGRPAVVILDHSEYERLQKLDEESLIARAEAAEESGYVGSDETMRFIREKLEG